MRSGSEKKMGIFQRQNNVSSAELEQMTNCKTSPSSMQKLYDLPGAKPLQAKETLKSASPYGIQDAIKLMRNLPNANQDVIIAVVKQTLESAAIKVSDIIVDAEYKESSMESQIDTLTAEVEKFTSEIKKRTEEIATVKLALEETTNVKDLLKLAQKSQIVEKLSESIQPLARPDVNAVVRSSDSSLNTCQTERAGTVEGSTKLSDIPSDNSKSTTRGAIKNKLKCSDTVMPVPSTTARASKETS